MKPYSKIVLTIFILWWAMLFVLLTIPMKALPVTPPAIPNIDKYVHFFLFMGASFWCYSAFYNKIKATNHPLRYIVLIIGITVLYGILTEFLQEMYFNRTGDYRDALADALGATAGIFVYRPIRNRFMALRHSLIKKDSYVNNDNSSN